MSRKALIVSVFVILLLVSIGTYLFVLRPIGERATAQARLFGFCLEVYAETNDPEGMQDCDTWSQDAFPAYSTQVIACHRLSPDLDSPFGECLVGEDILPPGIVRQ